MQMNALRNFKSFKDFNDKLNSHLTCKYFVLFFNGNLTENKKIFFIIIE